MTGTLLVMFISVGALAWVIAPLRGTRPTFDDSGKARAESEARKRSALAALLDLEDELRLGKISHEDFDALRAEHEAEALVALRELDLIDASKSDPVEVDIAIVRERLTCPACGGPRSPDERCPRCGA